MVALGARLICRQTAFVQTEALGEPSPIVHIVLAWPIASRARERSVTVFSVSDSSLVG